MGVHSIKAVKEEFAQEVGFETGFVGRGNQARREAKTKPGRRRRFSRPGRSVCCDGGRVMLLCSVLFSVGD